MTGDEEFHAWLDAEDATPQDFLKVFRLPPDADWGLDSLTVERFRDDLCDLRNRVETGGVQIGSPEYESAMTAAIELLGAQLKLVLEIESFLS
jgi:hypothetical protein